MIFFIVYSVVEIKKTTTHNSEKKSPNYDELLWIQKKTSKLQEHKSEFWVYMRFFLRIALKKKGFWYKNLQYHLFFLISGGNGFRGSVALHNVKIETEISNNHMYNLFASIIHKH